MKPSNEPSKPLHLLNDFPPTPQTEWRKAAEKLLRGKPFASLLTATPENIELQPIYTPEDAELPFGDNFPGLHPFVRGSTPSVHLYNPWQIAQDIHAEGREARHTAILQALENGQNAVVLTIGEDENLSRGTQILDYNDFRESLAGLDLRKRFVLLQCGANGLTAGAYLQAFCEQEKISLGNVHGAICFDPLKALVATGTLPAAPGIYYSDMAALTLWATNKAHHLQTVAVDVSLYHDAGANAVQELAFAMATAVDYIRGVRAADEKIQIAVLAPHLRFSFAVGSNFFMEISKLRAARWLWSRVVQAFGGRGEAQRMSLHARTSVFNKSRCDVHVNLLRTTTEAMAAIFGGCDSLQIDPLDLPLGQPGDLSQRLARNTHLILREEAHFDRVIDAAGGSWYVEKLTQDLAQKAWALFQQIESRGGMFRALQNGFVQTQVEKIAETRAQRFATRKEKLIGTNVFPNPQDEAFVAFCKAYTKNAGGDGQHSQRKQHQRKNELSDAEKTKIRLARKAGPEAFIEALSRVCPSGVTNRGLMQAAYAETGTNVQIEPLQGMRAAEPFENLRLRTFKHAQKTGKVPVALLLGFGAAGDSREPADLAGGFFRLAGFAIEQKHALADAAQALQEVNTTRADVLAICTSRALLQDVVPDVVQALKKNHPAKPVVLAVPFADEAGAFDQAGADLCVHERTNVVQALTNILDQIGVWP